MKSDANTVDLGFRFTLHATRAQQEVFSRHAGARRFAYNWCVANHRALRAKKREGQRVDVPASTFDNIHAFNQWKRSPEAGTREDGSVGLSWRRKVDQGVFEEGAKDFGQALMRTIKNVLARKKGITRKKVGAVPIPI